MRQCALLVRTAQIVHPKGNETAELRAPPILRRLAAVLIRIHKEVRKSPVLDKPAPRVGLSRSFRFSKTGAETASSKSVG